MKPSDQEISFKILNEHIDLTSFKCLEADLNEFLLADALKDQTALLSVTRLAYKQGKLVGFFTIVNGSIKSGLIDTGYGEEKYQYTYYPALKIARLATHVEFERQGVGRTMLQRTLAIALNLSKYTGCRFITVDAKKRSIDFYLKYGFRIPGSMVGDIEKKEIIPLYKDLARIY